MPKECESFLSGAGRNEDGAGSGRVGRFESYDIGNTVDGARVAAKKRAREAKVALSYIELPLRRPFGMHQGASVFVEHELVRI